MSDTKTPLEALFPTIPPYIKDTLDALDRVGVVPAAERMLLLTSRGRMLRPDSILPAKSGVLKAVEETVQARPKLVYDNTCTITRSVRLKRGKVDETIRHNRERFKLEPDASLKRYLRGRFTHQHKGKALRQHRLTGDVIQMTLTLGKVFPTSISVASDAVIGNTLTLTLQESP